MESEEARSALSKRMAVVEPQAAIGCLVGTTPRSAKTSHG